MELGDLADVANRHAVALELTDQVVGHRLAQAGPAVEQGDQSAAAGEPDRRLAGGVAAADHTDTGRATELRLGRPRGIEHADALVIGESLDRQAAVLRAGGEQDRARRDLVALL